MKDKSIADTIASLRADLDRLEARVKEQEKPIIEYSTRITWREHKTRYNWPEIIKQYPEAQWASTDWVGMVCYWIKKPRKADYWADSLEKRPDYL